MDFGNLAIFQRYFMSDPDGTYALLDYLVQGTTAPTPDTLSHGGPISLAGPGPPRTLRRLSGVMHAGNVGALLRATAIYLNASFYTF